jgi:hypothetical protein
LNVASIRSGLARNLSRIDGVQVNAYAQAAPTAPGLQILPPSAEYDFTFGRGVDRLTFIVQGYVSLASGDFGPQMVLDVLCAGSGLNSVKGAVEADKTLGGSVESARVVSQSPGRMVEPSGSGAMLLVEWTVDVLARGLS